jgi:pyrroline-5-carboxylate reductase
MPNTPALVQSGASGIAKGQFASNDNIELISKIMSLVGLSVQVAESDLDAVTGVSGSGPAYVLMFIEALTQGGVAAGLTYPISYQLALQTVYGTSKMLIDTKQHPAILREQICSPGGTTITGLKALHEGSFSNSVIQCVLDAIVKY